MRLMDRDLELLYLLFKFQCMTVLQVSRLFQMNIKVCQRRLRKLSNAGHLQKLQIPSTKPGKCPYLYYAWVKGVPKSDPKISKPRLTLQLSHQQKNTNLMIDIILAFKGSIIKCDVLPEHTIRIAENDVIPDGAFILRKNKNALFMLENCSGTEIIKSPSLNQDIETKIIRYKEMFEENTISFYESYFETSFNRFRLLYITNNQQRLNAISRVVKEHDSHGFIWLCTLSDFNSKGILEKIWQVPALNKSNVSIIG